MTKRKGYDLKTSPLAASSMPEFVYLETGKANGLELILLAEFGKPSEPRGDDERARLCENGVFRSEGPVSDFQDC